jgi:hypothetical protein
MNVIEQRESTDAADLEAWAKKRELQWIHSLAETGADLVNDNVFWKHPSRSMVDKGVRQAWCILHEIVARIDCSEPVSTTPSFHGITRFRAFRAIESLRLEYPGLAIAPLEWMQADPMDGVDAGLEEC